MPASNLLKKVEFQTALMPEYFFKILNSEKVEAMELNEENSRNGRFYHRIVYKGVVFVTNTENRVYEL